MNARFALAMVLIVLLVVALLSAIFAGVARAQQINCDDYQRIVSYLEQRYHEHTVAVGALATGRMMQIVASPQGSFTIILVGPDGIACLILSGDGWQVMVQGSRS